jgi:hypothetical protein
MRFFAGTSKGMFDVNGPAVRDVAELAGQTVRCITAINGALFAGAERGIYRSQDRGGSWRAAGIPGRTVWDVATPAGDPRTVFAVTQPPGLFQTSDGGDSWREISAFVEIPGAERWCVPVDPPQPGRARTVLVYPAAPYRFLVGVEVGGVIASGDGGSTWRCRLPGGNPDIHVLIGHPGRPGVVFATTGYGRIDDSEPMEQRIAGLFRSDDGGETWRYAWEGIQPRYTRPMCIDPRPPHPLTVGCAPTAFSSHRDPDGAQAMLYRSDDDGETWRSLGDAGHAPSRANFLGVAADPDTMGGVLVGTDTGKTWRVSPKAEWILLASGLPPVWAICPLP